MAKLKTPHLTSVDGVKMCSVCKQPFPENSQPSVRKAFAQHVRTVHAKQIEAPEKTKIVSA
jgi:hypothetical protein